MKQSIDTLISWFERGDKPLAAHFVAWLNSYWHKDEKIPQSAVEGLSDSLASVPSPELLQALSTGSIPTYQDIIELSDHTGASPNAVMVFVKDIGFFLYEETGTPDDVLYFASSDSGVWKKQSGSGEFPEAPTTPNTIYGRSGELEDWVEAVPVTLTKDITINIGDFNLNEEKTTPDYTYQEWKYEGGIERRITENATQTKVVEEIAYNYKRDYVSYNDGVDQFDNYRQIEQVKIEDTVIVNDEDFYRSRIDDTGIELSVTKTTPSIFKRLKVALTGIFLSNLFIENTPTENPNPTGKKLLVRDATTGEIQSIDVTNLGLGNPLFKGVYVSLVALQTAYPTGTSGDYAYVDAGVGQNIVTYVWDNNDSSWVLQSGSSGGISEAPNDGLPYVRQSLGWVQGVLKSTYDAFVSATNSALSTITTKLNKYPETGTTGKFIKGSSGNYVEGDVDWAEIQNKPTTFTPSAHTHPISDVTNLQSTLDTKENKLNTYQSISSISGVLTLDFNISKNWRIVLTENITLMIINNLPDGGEMNLQLTQNATAPYYTVVLPSLTKVSNYGTGTILMSNFNSAIDYVAFKKVNSVLFADHFPAYN